MLRWALTVLASIWFFPVSCATALGIGTGILTASDARDSARGDTVHSSIAVVALPPREPGEPFRYFLLGGAAQAAKDDPGVSFLMPAKEGRITVDSGSTTVTYKVVSGSDSEQTIETDYQDGDHKAWGRYRATRRAITPLASKLQVGYEYGAFPFALVFSFAVFFGAGFARRRMQRNGGT